MKKLLLLSIVFMALAGSTAFGQVKKGTINAVIQTPTVQCEQCKKRIEDDLKRVDGILKVVVDFKKKVTKVSFLADRTNIEYIKTAIANVGYDADDVAANPEAYKRLPKSCQKQ